MKVFNCQSVEVLKVRYYVDYVGREKEDAVHFKSIQADIQETNNQLEITLYGDRVTNMLKMFSNEDVETEDIRISYEGEIYQIISKVKYSAFEPTHWVYTLEMM